MLNTILGLLFVAVAVAAFVWRTFRGARDVADGTQPDAAGPAGIGMAGSDFSGISGGS